MSYTFHKFVLCAISIGIATSVHALGTDRAKGTKVVVPQNPVDTNACLACHAPVKQLFTRGAHRDLNCSSCHTVPSEHMKTPSKATRPQTRFDYASCSQCHTDQHKELMDPKYHLQWAKKGGNTPYAFIQDPADGWPLEVQFRIPRFHVGVMTDFMANRSDGRFMYKNKTDQAKPIEKHWDALEDVHPEKGLTNKGDIVGMAWRPHKGREATQESRCLVCKTTDNMLEYATGYAPNPKGYDFTTRNIPFFKNSQGGFNCNFCHDPHSAEPRIIIDPIIESMTGKLNKDSVYNKNVGKKPWTKLEVIEMGVRGYPRRIGILKEYDSNYMCGQCHNGAFRYTARKGPDGKNLTEKDTEKLGVAFYGTEFFANPIEINQTLKKRGWTSGVDAKTGVTKYDAADHHHLETLTNSKHGAAGVGCADCHFAKKADGSLEHQPSLVKEKVQNTCMRSECHGPGSKTNWTDPGQPLYLIETIQQEYRVRTNKMEKDAKVAREMLTQVQEGKATMPEKELNALKDAYSQHLTTRYFYFTDYSKGFHDPDGFNKTASKVIFDLRKANKDAKAVIKPVAAK